VTDIVVIGAGPAGMAAAATAAEAGLAATVFDDNPAPGGQAYRGIEAVAAKRPDDYALLGADFRRGGALVTRLRAAGATVTMQVGVWSLDPDGTVGIIDGGRVRTLRPRRVIVAAGAMERPVPVPGWSLPGVMTRGAAQTLLKASGVIPDRPTVIAGSGPLLYLAGAQLIAAGAPVAAVLDTRAAGNGRAAWRHLPGALLAHGAIRKGLAWRRAVTASDVPYYRAVTEVRAEGNSRLRAVSFRSGNRQHRLDAGILLLHEGIVPSHHLAALAGCGQTWDDGQICWRTKTDSWGATTVDTIAVAGDCGAIGGADLAAHNGTLAGLDAAYRLGALSRAERDARGAPVGRAIRRLAPLRRFLDAYYRPRDAVLCPPDDAVMVCRCEEITAGAIRKAAALGGPGPNQLKAYTRAGMGPCQSRMCAGTVAALLAEARGVPVADIEPLRVRPPLKPLTVGQLAQLRD